jgi:signal transduction histidine kinase
MSAVGIRARDAAVAAAGVAALVAMPAAGLISGRLGDALLPLPNSAAYLLVGAYAVWRRPDHPAARWLLRWGAATAVAFGWGAVYSAVVTVGPAPAWGWLALEALHVLGWLAAAASLAFLAGFPDGRYRTRADAIIVRAVLWMLPVAVLVELLGVPTITESDFVWGAGLQAANPLALPGLAGAGAVAMWAVELVSPVALLTGAVLLLVRWVRSDATVRRRIQWPLAAGLASAVLMLALGALTHLGPALPDWLLNLLYLPLVFLIPAGVLVGMLWYDLFDLGVVVRRSLLYTGLWVAIAAGFAVVAAVAGVEAARRLPLGIAVATTVVAVAIAAVARHRLTRIADRIVFGGPVDAAGLMDAVAADSPAGAPVGAAVALADAVRVGIRARWVRVRIGDEDASSVASGETLGSAKDAALHASLPPSATVRGDVACGPRESGRYGARDRSLLETLTRLAALSSANVQLSGELAARVDELEASRVRILRAEEAGRRRLERDLHDGVQQDLVALLARLGLASHRLKRDAGLAAETLAEAHEDARRALEDLQELVRGIHPTLLTDQGLVAALEARAARLPLPVMVDADAAVRGARLVPEAADAMYFALAECLTNVVKHADARTATVRLRCDGDGTLRATVRDDGRGMRSSDAARGTGLAGLRDRLEALGGSMRIRQGTPAGTEIALRLPAAIREGADV